MTERITSIDQIYDQKTGKCLIKDKDFSYKDLSNLDLSSIPHNFWKGAIFYYTNLHNTGIKFYPRKLKRGVEGCDFSDNDLSYLNNVRDAWSWMTVRNTSFKNTNLFNYDGLNGEMWTQAILDESFVSSKTEKFWDNAEWLQLRILKKNPAIKVSSRKLLKLIKREIPSYTEFISYEEIECNLAKCEALLAEFEKGKSIQNLYHKICDHAESSLQKLRFFQGHIMSYRLYNIVFNESDIKILNTGFFSITDCKFYNVTFEIQMRDVYKSNLISASNEFHNVVFPKINYEDWRHIPINEFSETIEHKVTVRKNVYVELGSQCNCRCLFCRNQSFCRKDYNFKKIKDNLKTIEDNMDSIIIGGGEPTLRYDDLLKIVDSLNNVIVVTNGSLDPSQLKELLCICKSVYISRHAIDDEENLKILNPQNGANILTFEEITSVWWNRLNRVTLTPVCVKGGLDSSYKIIDYISKAFKAGINNIIISSLHKDASLGSRRLDYRELYVDPIIFEEVKRCLKLQGFTEKPLIVSTGGYTLNIFDGYNDKRVVFKTYVDKKTLKERWIHSYKKTFDFTMTPNGKTYEDWAQENEVKLREFK